MHEDEVYEAVWGFVIRIIECSQDSLLFYDSDVNNLRVCFVPSNISFNAVRVTTQFLLQVSSRGLHTRYFV